MIFFDMLLKHVLVLFLCCFFLFEHSAKIQKKDIAQCLTVEGLDQHAMPLIFGIQGTELTSEERVFFAKNNPTGFILFGRNIKSIMTAREALQKAATKEERIRAEKELERAEAGGYEDDLRNLIADLKKCVKNRFFVPILIDQEGGIANRLRNLYPDVTYPTALSFGRMIKQGKHINVVKQKVADNFSILSKQLNRLGINVNCAPVADLYDHDFGIRGKGNNEANQAIKSRSFSQDVDIVVELSKSAIGQQRKNGVISVVKHLPGHGLAVVDSHKELPVISNSLKDLEEHDFKVFKNLAKDGVWGMVAHVAYENLDFNTPASQSKKIVDYIRNNLGFKGKILVSDDIRMQALKEDMGTRAMNGIHAGLDLIIYGGDNLIEMQEIVDKLHKEGVHSISDIRRLY